MTKADEIWVRVSVTAYFTSDEGLEFEKQIGALALTNGRAPQQWADLMESFVKAAINKDELPNFEGVRRMNEAEIEDYLETQKQED